MQGCSTTAVRWACQSGGCCAQLLRVPSLYQVHQERHIIAWRVTYPQNDDAWMRLIGSIHLQMHMHGSVFRGPAHAVMHLTYMQVAVNLGKLLAAPAAEIEHYGLVFQVCVRVDAPWTVLQGRALTTTTHILFAWHWLHCSCCFCINITQVTAAPWKNCSNVSLCYLFGTPLGIQRRMHA